MRTIKYLFLLVVFVFSASISYSQGRLIRKIQEKAEDKAIEEIFKDKKTKKKEQYPDYQDTESDYDKSGSSRQQRKSGGLSKTAPDVLQNIADAESAFKDSKYSESKSYVRQALWDIELEIGRKLLNSLPESVEGLKFIKEDDRVTSTGIGFVGLLIERVYQGKDDMQLNCTIGNDSAILGLAGTYMMGDLYKSSTDETNQKTIRFQDHRAKIEYNDSEGYKLNVPFGQSSVFVLQGVNFDSEEHFMRAADNFDIETIKKELGE